MRTGITSICHEPVVRDVVYDDGRTERKEVRCNTPFSEKRFQKEVCVSCGRDKGSGHIGPDCVSSGEVRYLPVTAKGAFCAENHPYPVG